MKKLLLVFLFSSLALPALAHSFQTGAIEIGHPWAPPTALGATTAEVYLALMNMGDKADQLKGARTSIAHKAQLFDGKGTVQMIDLPSKRGVALRPGGMAVRLEGLKGGLTEGDRFTLRLQFAEAAPVDVVVYVENHASHQ